MKRGTAVVGFLVGAAVVLYGGEKSTPGSSAEQVNAGRAAAGNVVQGVMGVAGDAIVAAGPLMADVQSSLQASGIGNVLTGTPQGAPADGTVSPPSQQAPGVQP